MGFGFLIIWIYFGYVSGSFRVSGKVDIVYRWLYVSGFFGWGIIVKGYGEKWFRINLDFFFILECKEYNFVNIF